MCKRCENYKYFLLWVLSQENEQSLPKDILMYIMDKYLSCYYTGNDEHEQEDFARLCLFDLFTREWYNCIVMKPLDPEFISNIRFGYECGYDFYTCVYGMSGYMNN